MSLLDQKEPTVTLGKPPPENKPSIIDGNCKPSLDRRQHRYQNRTEGYRLSCISEQEKGNRRSYEDEYLASYAEAIKTPLLKPTRLSHSRRQGQGKSRSSDGSFAVSPFRLDSEQIVACREQEIKSPVVSTWLCTVSIESKDQAKPDGPSGVLPEPPSSASPKIFEVEWQSTRWNGTQLSKVYIERHKRTLSGTGFDGPLSCISGTSPLQSRSVSTSPLRSLTPSNCPACKSRNIESGSSGSINWEKSWPRRKPRRVHNVSESSDFDSSTHAHQLGCPTIVIEGGNSAEGSNMDTPTYEEQEDQQSQLRDVQECAMKSCPEFHRRPPSTMQPPPMTRCSVRFHIAASPLWIV
jgi:hypothetical protein